MKIVILVFSLLFGISSFSQKDCEYGTEVSDTIGTFRETKSYLMYEKVFGGKSTYLFFSLANEDGTPFLKVQKIEKSADFLPATCFDAQSKIYIQLLNGKIVTLIYGDEETCGNLIRVENENLNNRLITANFLFIKGTIEDLKSSPIWEIRIRYATETTDFIVRKELVSELTKETTAPETYFMNYLKCVID
jgi:hypothetical protein